MSDGPALSAILVNYNAGDELRRALQSIADEMHGRSWEALVIDNASIDDSRAIVAEFEPMASLVVNSENVGFARAVNQGLALTAARRVLIMNPDCRLMAGAIAALGEELDQHEFCAIAGPRILNPDGSVQGSARGDPDMLTGLFGRTGVLGRLMPWAGIARRNVVSEAAIRSGHPSVVVDWLSGACILAQRDALAKVKGFDERYFLYWEDADLCRRLRAAGYHVRYVPGATAIHRVGHSSRTVRAAAIRAFHTSAYLYYTTHNAPRPLQPKRVLAKVILSGRQWFLLRGARSS
jgi:N-acetylglucosaminyl-diphospho-decaprenol L-rhamnosyltransferase